MKVVAQRYRQALLSELQPHPQNPRQGDVGAIHTSIEANGFYGALVVQKSSGFVLAGNHTLLAARDSGAVKVPILELDVDDETALKILLVDNRSSDLATYDDPMLLGILAALNEHASLVGTGYEESDLEALNRVVNDPFVPPEEPKPKTSTIVGKRTCPECGHEWIEGEKDD